MGRRSKSQALSVWMNGERVGEWRRPAARGQEFVYAESWLSSPAARPISLSLPLRPSREPYRTGVEAFFDNLLPDNRQIRERIQRRFRTASIGAFDLLQEIGRDCVGALQLLPEDQSPVNIKQITGERLTTDGVEELLTRSLTSTSPGLKYESDGGPGIGDIMELLLGSEQAAKDRRDFMRTQFVFWMLAAIDGHAKNFSVFLLPLGAYKLALRYDILSAYPVLG